MLKKLVVAAAVTGLVASPVAAAGPTQRAPLASPEILPAPEQVEGQEFLNSTAGPLLMFALVVAIGVTIALLVKTNDQPASP